MDNKQNKKTNNTKGSKATKNTTSKTVKSSTKKTTSKTVKSNTKKATPKTVKSSTKKTVSKTKSTTTPKKNTTKKTETNVENNNKKGLLEKIELEEQKDIIKEDIEVEKTSEEIDVTSLVKDLNNNIYSSNNNVNHNKKKHLNLFKLLIVIAAILLLCSLVFGRKSSDTSTKKENQNKVVEKKKKEKKVPELKEEEKADRIPIFTFHRIVSDKLKHEKFEENEWAASADVFEEQIKYLYDNGYKTISMDEFYCWYRKKCDFPKKTVMITFDDGNADDYYLVMPILRKYNYKATTFIVGARTLDIDENPYDENIRTFITRELITKTKNIYPNLEYQSHTYDLHYVDSNKKERVLNASQQEIYDDFENNKSFGFKYLAYPYGIYNDKIIKALKKYKYNLAFTFRVHECATRENNQYEIPRIKINGFSDVEEIKKWLDY